MKLRVLIFDDDPTMRQLLWLVCDQRGYEVFTFPEPGLCPLRAKDTCPCDGHAACADVIISDLEMPHTRGIDFVEKLLGNGCRCRHLALMSGGWSEGEVARAATLGCKVFSKPFHISEVSEWLDQVHREITPNRMLRDWHALRTASARESGSEIPSET